MQAFHKTIMHIDSRNAQKKKKKKRHRQTCGGGFLKRATFGVGAALDALLEATEGATEGGGTTLPPPFILTSVSSGGNSESNGSRVDRGGVW